MDKLLSTLNEYLKQASSMLAQYTPQVWGATLRLIHIQAIVQISLWVLFILITAIWWWKGFPYFLKVWRDKDNKFSYETSDTASAACVVGSIFAVGSHVAQMLILYFNVMDWGLALIDPRLLILYRIAEKVGIL